MIECTSSDICSATSAALLSGTGDERARGVAIDSRKVGCLLYTSDAADD